MIFIPETYEVNQLRILHISDTHSHFDRLKDQFDLIVHSGDFFPDPPNKFFGPIEKFQKNWLETNIRHLKEQVQDKPYFFVLGNHDFYDDQQLETYLRSEGIKATSLHNKRIEFEEIYFYGFPYMDFINQYFNYGLDEVELKIKIDEMFEKFTYDKVDVLVSHAPFQGVLDAKGHYSSKYMREALEKAIKENKAPSHYLCGHCHRYQGVAMFNNMLVSNAATTQNIIQIIK